MHESKAATISPRVRLKLVGISNHFSLFCLKIILRSSLSSVCLDQVFVAYLLFLSVLAGITEQHVLKLVMIVCVMV